MRTAEKFHITWDTFDDICRGLADKLRAYAPDLIVGIARGGLPVATVLSHELGCKDFTSITARKTLSEGPAGFEDENPPEVKPMGWLPDTARRVLIVDDVVSLGDVFSDVADVVRPRINQSAEIRFACLYGDEKGISEGPYSEILDRTAIGHSIDNRARWVVFPWERDE